ncbi:MAG TPA: hypothetical protein VEB64_15640 [Azospirillaceae bacterium]|nr:hypothetical protein [Azospirillaceae bacterium]
MTSVAEAKPARDPRLRVALLLGFADQALVSAANLGLGLIVLHGGTKEEYGLYGLGSALVLLFTGAVGGMISSQMTAIAPNRQGNDALTFCAAMGIGQVWICGPLAVAGLALIGGLYGGGTLGRDMAAMLAASALAGVGVAMHEYFRSFMYLQFHPGRAFGLTLSLVAVWTVTTVLLVEVAAMPAHWAAIVGYGGGSLVSSLIALRWSGLPWRAGRFGVGAALAEAWPGGRWALLGVVSIFAQNQSYIYLLTVLDGPAAVGEANAARLLLAPLMLIIVSTIRTLQPRVGRSRAAGDGQGVWRLSWITLFTLLATTVLYSVGVIAVMPYAIGTLLPEAYAGVTSLTVLWSIAFVAQCVRSVPQMLLQVIRGFRQITSASIVSGALVFVISLVAIPYAGVFGSLMCIVGGEILLSLLLARNLVHARRSGAFCPCAPKRRVFIDGH